MARPIRLLVIPGCVLWTVSVAIPAGSESVGEDFPRFVVPGHEKAMNTLRGLFQLHYRQYCRRGKPMPTLWDDWLSGSTLWPAVQANGTADKIRRGWAEGLSNRILDPEGYVSSHQHASIAHQQGWPFPFWQQGRRGTWGWHFSLRGVPHDWDGSPARTQKGWSLRGARDLGVAEERWNLELTEARASATTPPLSILPDQSPFIQLRWQAEGLKDAQPFLEWATESRPEFGPDRRFYFAPAGGSEGMVYTMIPVYRSASWNGRITQLRLNFDNSEAGGKVGIQALFTQYDTRHNVNNAGFVRGSCKYFHWTRDLNFLRENLQRLRLATRYMMEHLGGSREGCIIAPFAGHDGRSGIERRVDGKKIIHSGQGISNNYWDILPTGYRDAYATAQYYDALGDMARLEEEVTRHPEWNLPAGPLSFDCQTLRQAAKAVKDSAGKLFWSPDTGRFVAGIDRDGKAHDYGSTFLNCEAVCYGFATKEQSESIMQWLTGERTVAGDTSQGADIYHWRFGPRSTTKRNIDWYGWYWYDPESLPWGGQVQDGGAVLGFSYHDLLARLKSRGPDNAWARLQAILAWFDEVQAAGGYREYYKGKSGVTLQGCGTCGGLGLDCEFYESILVPQIMIDGFLGFEPRGDGFEIRPHLPSEWPQLTVTRIHFHQLVLDVTVDRDTITVAATGQASEPLFIYPPIARWQITSLSKGGRVLQQTAARITEGGQGVRVRFKGETTIKLSRTAPPSSQSSSGV